MNKALIVFVFGIVALAAAHVDEFGDIDTTLADDAMEMVSMADSLKAHFDAKEESHAAEIEKAREDMPTLHEHYYDFVEVPDKKVDVARNGPVDADVDNVDGEDSTEAKESSTIINKASLPAHATVAHARAQSKTFLQDAKEAGKEARDEAALECHDECISGKMDSSSSCDCATFFAERNAAQMDATLTFLQERKEKSPFKTHRNNPLDNMPLDGATTFLEEDARSSNAASEHLEHMSNDWMSFMEEHTQESDKAKTDSERFMFREKRRMAQEKIQEEARKAFETEE